MKSDVSRNPWRTIVTLVSASLLGVSSAHAQSGSSTYTSTASGNWSDQAKWLSNNYAFGTGSTATTSSSNGGKTITLDIPVTIGSIVFSDGASGNIHTIAGPNTLNLDVSSGNANLQSSQRYTKSIISADISGNDGIDMNSPGGNASNGFVVLSGNNIYTGGTMLTNGVLGVGSNTALGVDTVTFNGGGIATSDSLDRTLANPIAFNNNVLVGKTNSNNPTLGTGALTFSDTSVTALGATRTFTVDSGLRATFAQAFSGGGFGITKAGAGTLELTGANTYDGTTTVSGGTLIFSGSNNSSGAISTASGAVLQLNSNSNGGMASGSISLTNATIQAINADRTITNQLQLGGNGVVAGDYSIVTSSNLRIFNGNRQLTNTVASGKSLTVGGIIGNSSPRNLTLEGTGTTIVNGDANSNVGTIAINGGTLLFNGGNSTTSIWTVGALGTLGGNGTIGGATTINGLLAPGNSPGVLTFNSTLTLNGTTLFEIDGLSHGSQYDGVNTVGLLTYGGNLTFDFGTTLSGNTTFDLFSFAGPGNQTGNFTTGGVNLAGNYTGSFTNNGSGVWVLNGVGGGDWTFTQSTGDLQFIAVPEPGTVAILGAGATLAGLRLARRRASGSNLF